MNNKQLHIFNKLRQYCESEHFKGWDPYDGLNSKIFQNIPLLHKSALCRLIMIQGFKRMPFNLRPLFLVPKEYNSKGIGLFLQGYCNLYTIIEKTSKEDLSKEKERVLSRIHQLAELLIALRSKGYSGSCWGYNFDWQARRLFFFPKNPPTVVATSFCAEALISAYKITRKENYLANALSAVNFVIQDLHRTPQKRGFLFSYSPLPGNDTVYNASLLGSKILSYGYHYTQNTLYKELAGESVLACCDAQKGDGSWSYGMLPVQTWKDSFHTGYNLDCIQEYQTLTGDTTFSAHIENGFKYYIQHFFENDGTPKYYDNKTYPIDIHCPGQLLVTLSKLKKYAEHKELADKVVNWTITNMQDSEGYFYYQLKQFFSSHIPYMRWSNAFMFNALSYYLLEQLQYEK